MKYIKTQDILNKEVLTYREILNVKRRLNGYTKGQEPAGADNYEFKEEYTITPEHTAKGLEYLYRVAFKPSKFDPAMSLYYSEEEINEKIMRKNSPLGLREAMILCDFDHFTFTGFYDASNYYQNQLGYHNYLPIWKCYSKEDDSFEYYLEAGKMQIIG